MRVIAKTFLILGILFWGVFLSIDLFKFIAMNGAGDFFPIDNPEVTSLKVKEDSTHIDIVYSYKINEGEYHESYRMVKSYYEKCSVDTLVVNQNRVFPKVSYIENIPLKLRQAKIGIVISSFFILFLLLLWKLSNKNKTAKMYEEVGNRPWIYPDDKTIKNPFKRLLNRLFKK
jgi:hypothetical protein